jgi:hypothetical protein
MRDDKVTELFQDMIHDERKICSKAKEPLY